MSDKNQELKERSAAATTSSPAEELRTTIRKSWEKGRKKAKSKSMRNFDLKKKSEVSKRGYSK
jgi:hypothetical protein